MIYKYRLQINYLYFILEHFTSQYKMTHTYSFICFAFKKDYANRELRNVVGIECYFQGDKKYKNKQITFVYF